MTWLDIAIAVALALSVFAGLRTGLIKAVLNLIGFVVGVFLAGRFYGEVAGLLGLIPHEGAAKVIAFIIIVVIVMLIASIAAWALTSVVSAIMLGWVNRLGGAAFGLVMAAMTWEVLLAIWVKFLGPSDIIAQSPMASFLLINFPVVLSLLPGEFDTVRSFFK